MAKTKPSLVSIGTFWLISFARGANLLRCIVSGFSVPSSPFIPWSYPLLHRTDPVYVAFGPDLQMTSSFLDQNKNRYVAFVLERT
jgi:hypothetical protein